MQAARDSTVGAQCLGVNVRNTRLLMWAIAALWTGATGALIHLNSSTVTNQDAFSVLSWTALVVFIVVIGGVGSQTGPIIGVVIYWFITKRFEDSDTWRFIILGTVAVVMAAVARSGVDGLLQRIHPFEVFPVRRRLRQEEPSHMSEDVYILDAVRTPVGRLGGALAGLRPDDLAATAVKAVVDRLPDLDPGAIEEIYFGDANQAGEDNRNVARMAVLLAGLPVTIPGATVNRLCGSGLEAVIDASRAVAVGDADVVLAGGVESMSRAPWVLPKPAKGYPTGHEQLWSTTLGWRMTNPRMPSEWTIALGEGAEVLADKYSISREEQDAFALGSHRRAAAGVGRGLVRRRGGAGGRRPARAGTSASGRTPPRRSSPR